MNVKNKIVAVTGATGTLGRALVRKLGTPSTSVRCLSRKAKGEQFFPVDLNDGSGLDRALRGADTVVHLASAARDGNMSGDALQTGNLIKATKQSGIQHLLYVSIVGIDRIPFTYYKSKLECERLIQQSGIPYTIIRATQFHEFIDELLNRAMRLGALWIPKSFKFQAVDAESVADYLALSLQRTPPMAVENIGGSEVSTFHDMAKAWMAVRGLSKTVIGLPLFGKVAAGFRNGYNTTRHALSSCMTWEEWLIRKYGIDAKKFETTEMTILSS